MSFYYKSTPTPPESLEVTKEYKQLIQKYPANCFYRFGEYKALVKGYAIAEEGEEGYDGGERLVLIEVYDIKPWPTYIEVLDDVVHNTKPLYTIPALASTLSTYTDERDN